MVDIREGTIVRYDDDAETPWLVVYIDDGDSVLNTPISSKLVWIRKMTKLVVIFDPFHHMKHKTSSYP